METDDLETGLGEAVLDEVGAGIARAEHGQGECRLLGRSSGGLRGWVRAMAGTAGLSVRTFWRWGLNPDNFITRTKQDDIAGPYIPGGQPGRAAEEETISQHLKGKARMISVAIIDPPRPTH